MTTHEEVVVVRYEVATSGGAIDRVEGVFLRPRATSYDRERVLAHMAREQVLRRREMRLDYERVVSRRAVPQELVTLAVFAVTFVVTCVLGARLMGTR